MPGLENFPIEQTLATIQRQRPTDGDRSWAVYANERMISLCIPLRWHTLIMTMDPALQKILLLPRQILTTRDWVGRCHGMEGILRSPFERYLSSQGNLSAHSNYLLLFETPLMLISSWLHSPKTLKPSLPCQYIGSRPGITSYSWNWTYSPFVNMLHQIMIRVVAWFLLASAVFGQVPYDPTPFNIVGTINGYVSATPWNPLYTLWSSADAAKYSMSLDSGGPLAGGSITVDGQVIKIPANLLATLRKEHRFALPALKFRLIIPIRFSPYFPTQLKLLLCLQNKLA